MSCVTAEKQAFVTHVALLLSLHSLEEPVTCHP